MALNQAGGASVGAGVAFLVAAGIVAETIAKACSSPQTTQLNSHRAPTLMKWVNIGAAEAALFVAIAAIIDPAHRTAYLAGGALELVITYAEYMHAKQAAVTSSAPGTETTPAGSGPVRWGWA